MGQKIALLTGFGPFGAYASNPTQQAVENLHGRSLGNCLVHGEVLASSYDRAPRRVLELASQLNPVAILSLGYASRTPRIRVEVRGFNEQNSLYCDADGACYDGVPIEPGGADFYYTNAPNKALVEAMVASGIDAELSNDAERFICNRLIYSIAMKVAAGRLPTVFAYVHTPTPASHSSLIDGQAGKVIIPTGLLERAAVIAMETMCEF